MKKIIFLLVMFLPLMCSAQYMVQDPNAKFKYDIGDVVYIPFDELVGLCVLDSEDRVSDSIAIRKQLMEYFDTTRVKAKVMIRFFIEKYDQAYYKVDVFDKKGRQVATPTKQTDATTLRSQVVAERILIKMPILL